MPDNIPQDILAAAKKLEPSFIVRDLTWVKHHIALLVVTALLVTGGVLGVQHIIDKHDAARDAQWQAIISADRAASKQLADQYKVDQAARDERDKQRDAFETSLLAEIAKRDAATDQQRKKDATLNAAETAQRITQLTHAQPGEVVASGDTVIADLPIARAITSALDLLPSVQLDLISTQHMLDAEKGKSADAKAQADDLQKQLDAQKKTNVDQVEACKASTKVAVEHEKKKHKWYAVGGIFLFEIARAYLGKP
jgi:hypothetical protein